MHVQLLELQMTYTVHSNIATVKLNFLLQRFTTLVQGVR